MYLRWPLSDATLSHLDVQKEQYRWLNIEIEWAWSKILQFLNFGDVYICAAAPAGEWLGSLILSKV